VHFLTIVAVVKDEDEYLSEWIEYHRLVGVNHFLLFDNDSVRPLNVTQSRRISDGIVTVVRFPGYRCQLPAYRAALHDYRDMSRWLAFIDVDEFIVPVSRDRVPDVLDDFHDMPGVVVNWKMFGANGHVDKPPGLVIENYTACHAPGASVNRHVKSIVQASQVADVLSPHAFSYLRHWAVDTDREIKRDGFSAARYDKLQLNHYFTKSLAEWRRKAARGRADTGEVRGQHEFDVFSGEAVDKDEKILRFVPQLKQVMGIQVEN